MDATPTDIDALVKLRNFDRDIALATRDLKVLPQREAIVEKRKQIAELTKKKVQVQDMLDSCEDQLTRIVQEDETLALKEEATQEKLDASRADYRSVESLSRDLNGVAKRREALSGELGEVEEKLARIRPVMEQVNAALAALGAKEASLVESFKKEGGELQHRIALAQRERKVAVEALDPTLMKAYDEALVRCGGVALAVLSEDSCSACRNRFDAGKLSQIKAEAPVSACPSCRRMLLVPGV